MATTLFLLILVGCSKDDTTTPQPRSTPILIGISPESGPKTTIVDINGSNFGMDVAAVQVFFNGKEAVVHTISDTQIKAEVPSKAYTGLVKVIVDGTTVTGPTFTYIISDIQVSTLAGSTAGFAEGTGENAQFTSPYGVAVDASGNVYVADRFNDKIRKITPEGMVSTLAGSIGGFANGTGENAQFDQPFRVAVDAGGNVYVSDTKNHKIRKITPSGVVSTLAGSIGGFANGTGENAQFDNPFGVAVDTEGNVYVADENNHKIRKITPNGSVSTLAGSTQGFVDGTGTNAQFFLPSGVALDGVGNLYVADTGNHKIRKITPDGVVTTVAGSTQGFANGPGTTAKFNQPLGVTIDVEGNAYVADTGNQKIRMITSIGVVSTLAGTTQGFMDGTGSIAQFNAPLGVSMDADGNMYLADGGNHKIRKISRD
ncbi:IPT/TIG domain-containing protein [Flavobacteriaceae bacterium 3-367]